MAVTNDISPAARAAAVDLSSTDAAVGDARSLYIGVSGDVTVDMLNGGTGILFKAHPVGYMLAQVSKVYKTGTTATNILALY